MVGNTGKVRNEKINVLVLDNSNGVTGAFKSIYTISSELGNEYEFYYGILPNKRLVDFLSKEGKKVIVVPFLEIQRNYRIVFYLPRLFLNTWHILRFIKSNDIRIVHVNDLYNMGGVMVKLLNRKVKVVYHVRLMPTSYVNRLYGFFSRAISKHADAVIAVSESVKDALSRSGIRAIVVYDTIAEAKHPSPLQREDTESITLLYLANFIQGKGHSDALKAFEIARKQIPNLKMIMAGGDLGLKKNVLLKQELMKSVEMMGLANHVTFQSFVEDVEKLMKSSDIVLNFSESESFSLTCLEALVYKVPLIASDSGGPKELFENGISGFLVPNKDVQAMADAIVRLSSSKSLRQSFADKGSEFVSNKFGLQKCVQALRSVYAQINH